MSSQIEKSAPADCSRSSPVYNELLFPFLGAISTAVLFDVTVFRGTGPAGSAVFFFGSLLIYWLATITKSSHRSFWLIGSLLLVLSLRLVWFGIPAQFFLGFLLLIMFAMSRNGMVVDLLDVFIYSFQSVVAAGPALLRFSRYPTRLNCPITFSGVLAVAFPVAAVVLFGGIFMAANPDLSEQAVRWATNFREWVNHFFRNIDFTEAIVIAVMFWLFLGQLIPLTRESVFTVLEQFFSQQTSSSEQAPAVLFTPFRNMLIAVNGLFAVYLAFEFQTLWFREFPEGFYYAGYAHQGAAWLTFALALATAMLSMIFRRAVLSDPRLPQLRRLAWIWSAANLLLALAVYNRMWIYIAFNGMTRMRVVGLFGITTVVAGFFLVIWKIRYQRHFLWLLQRQLWAFGFAVYLLTITPVDYLIHSYNVSQILSGHLAPAVQITEHPVSESGWLALVPLIHCEDDKIRNGIRAKLAGLELPQGSNWTDYQLVNVQLKEELAKFKNEINSFDSYEGQLEAWQQFKDYAYQWY